MYQTLGGVVFLIGLSIYLAPTVEATARKREAIFTIFLINLFLGWTVVGWFVATRLARGTGSERRRLQNVTKRGHRQTGRATIARIVAHAHDCPTFGRREGKAHCLTSAVRA